MEIISVLGHRGCLVDLGAPSMEKRILINGEQRVVSALEVVEDVVSFSLAGARYRFEVLQRWEDRVVLKDINGKIQIIWCGVGKPDGQRALVVDGVTYTISRCIPKRVRAEEEAQDDVPRAPLSGKVKKVLVAVGDTLEKGTAVAIVEAMKMQITVVAPVAGVVLELLVQESGLVSEGQELVRIKSSEGL